MTDKIKDLMKKCGLSDAASSEICEAIETLITSRSQQLKTEHDARLEEAKKVCVEEVEAYKRELARRLQIFCEAKGEAIERQIAKQTALKESASHAKLQNIQAMLSGVELNGKQNGDLQAENQKLRRQLQGLSEERDKAVTAANRVNSIAAKVLKRNRLLESQIKPAPAVAESKATKPEVQPKRSTQPATTRATLVENQDRRPVTRPAQQTEDYTPSSIAALIE